MNRIARIATLALCAAAIRFQLAAAAPAEEGSGLPSEAGSCLECHATWSPARVERFIRTVHGGLACSACHEAARELPHEAAASSARAACAKCHPQAVMEFEESVHKRAGSRGVKAFLRDCAGCHGEPHSIVKRLPPVQPEQVCARCHGSKAESIRQGLPARIWSTYEQSIHGQKRLLGSRTTPGCVDCHGSHAVTSPTSDGSEQGRANRARSCIRCHANATAAFSASFSHDPVDPASAPVAYLVSWLYSAAIACVLLLAGAWIGLELVSWSVRRRLGRALKLVLCDSEERWTRVQRVQHFVVLVSFVILVLTGMPLLAGDLDEQARLLALFGGVERAASIHRIAGTALIGVSLWHVGWLWKLRRRGEMPMTMLPACGDLVELRDQLRSNLLLDDRPGVRLAKYGWIEKLEYFGFAWGSLVMAVTGVLLWFPVAASFLLPQGGLLVVQLIHGYEAILATLFVFLWHFYQVHLKPGIFPMNWSWLTGREG